MLLFLVYFVSFIYNLFCCLADILVSLLTRLSAKQNNKYLALHKYSFLLMTDLERSETCRGFIY